MMISVPVNHMWIQIPLALMVVAATPLETKNNASNVASELERAKGELAAGRTEAAMSAFRYVLGIEPNNAIAHNVLGSLLNQSGHYVEALYHAEAAVAGDPTNYRYRYNRGVVLAEHGRFDESVADFDVAISANANWAYPLLEKGASLASLGRMTDARQSWSRARAVEPELVWNDWYGATGDMIEGRYEDAVAGFGRVAAASPEFTAAHLWYALANARLGNAISAPLVKGKEWPAPILTYFRGEIGVNELLAIAAKGRAQGDRRRSGEALFFIGQNELIAGRRASAIKYFQRAVRTKAPRHVWKLCAEKELQLIKSARKNPITDHGLG